ncbi:Holliday junction branch migration DNA helicase RuvB [Candidatus Uhrbacteria bacterium]|nr:Holliday junction branch migration DNA helicase RuvB [Candidatus Uhrbacteria bacterium]
MIERDEGIVPQAVADGAGEEERQVEVGLRPLTLSDFVGQDIIKRNLSILLEAAKGRGEPTEHVLLYGNPGLGKTTLAHIIAREMGSNFKVTSGPVLEKVGDLASILSNLKKGDVLFIDEIHRLNRTIEEVLYGAMEDFVLDIIVGKGPTARTLRLNLEPFTVIGATTRLSLLSAPLRDRFGAVFHLNYYSEEDLQAIVRRSASILHVDIDDPSVALLSTRCRFTPRIANRLLRRVRDVAQIRGSGAVDESLALEALAMLEIDPLGLDAVDRRLLVTIIELFHGGPVGLSTLAASSSEEIETIENVHEPFLLRIGMLERTPRGRVATPRAFEHIGLRPS